MMQNKKEVSKETFYFSHDYNARSDIKIQALLAEHGPVGYGVYWVIVEMLHEEAEKKIELHKISYVAIARQASTTIQQVKRIVECCLEYELFIEEEGCFFSKRVLSNIDKRMLVSEQRSKAGRKSAEKRKKASRQQNATNATGVDESATDVEENATDVDENSTKERKEKENKEKEKKENIHKHANIPSQTDLSSGADTSGEDVCVFDFEKALIDYGFDRQLVEEWLLIREKRNLVNSIFAFNTFISQIRKAGGEKNELLRLIAEQQWGKFNHKWLKDINNNNLQNIKNEKDRKHYEKLQRRKEIYDFARSVGMVEPDEETNSEPLW